MRTDNCFEKDHKPGIKSSWTSINWSLLLFFQAVLICKCFCCCCFASLAFAFILFFSHYFPQNSARGKYPRRHLLLRQWHVLPPSFSGAVQFTGPSHPGCGDSFPVVAPQLLWLWIQLPARCQTGKTRARTRDWTIQTLLAFTFWGCFTFFFFFLSLLIVV